MTLRLVPCAPSGLGGRRQRPQLSREDLVDAALELTRARGLHGWSMRGLARHTGVAPRTVARHLGNRRAVEFAVLQRVVGLVPTPALDQDAPWREWLTCFVGCLRAILQLYPGTAAALAPWAAVQTGPFRHLTRTLTQFVHRQGTGHDGAMLARYICAHACLIVALAESGGHRPDARVGEPDIVAYALARLIDGVAAALGPDLPQQPRSRGPAPGRGWPGLVRAPRRGPRPAGPG